MSKLVRMTKDKKEIHVKNCEKSIKLMESYGWKKARAKRNAGNSGNDSK